ncbi:hypothetical protein BJV74DRAFT_887836 [Russula compacta]|nr:hypothetical protein BJV74DRAFT_887836 [Russula compacta]
MALSTAFDRIQTVCSESNGNSQVFRSGKYLSFSYDYIPHRLFIGSHGHLSGIRHYYESSAEDASFSVEPGSADDLAKILKIIKELDVSFAVKSGGHATNPGFSSTQGIQISMSRFTNISYDQNRNQLTVGAGCLFDEIYKFIRPGHYNIVGGNGSVGVGGWFAGGGYSLKTNQYGLGIDKIVQVEVVLPDGTVETANEGHKSDLFWAIRGGGNNFGIVTEFVIETHPQGTNSNGYVYGGVLKYDKPYFEDVKDAIIHFQTMGDPKAAIEATLRIFRKEEKFTVLIFYDNEAPPPEYFAKFLDIPHQGRLARSSYTQVDIAMTLLSSPIPAEDVKILEEKDYGIYSFRRAIIGVGIMNARARWGNVMVSKYTRKLIDVVEEEASIAREHMKRYKGITIAANIWPFVQTMFHNSVDTAWPHKSGEPNGPLLVYFVWEGEENDAIWIHQMKKALSHIYDVAREEECVTSDAPVYCNTALHGDATPEDIYRDHLAALSALRTKYDPDNVMGKTGGWRIAGGPAIVNGSYSIKNAGGSVVGTQEPPAAGTSVKVCVPTQPFVISRVSGNTELYNISIGDYFAVDSNGDIRCGEIDSGGWKIKPESRRGKQLEYSIVDQAECKRWVLNEGETQVKCVLIDGPLDPEALWRFDLHQV